MGDTRADAPEDFAIDRWTPNTSYTTDYVIGPEVTAPSNVEYLYLVDPRQTMKEYHVYENGIYDLSLLPADSSAALILTNQTNPRVLQADTANYLEFSDLYVDQYGNYYRGHRTELFMTSYESDGNSVSYGAAVVRNDDGNPVVGGTHPVSIDDFEMLTAVSQEEIDEGLVNQQRSIDAGFVPRADDPLRFTSPDACFAAGTMISMFEGGQKPIEDIRKGDHVVSYTADGSLVRGEVTGTQTSRVTQLLDVFGLKVTPGHVTYCGDGKYAGKHVPIIDILRSDGALMREDGTMVRAATGCDVASAGDQWIEVVQTKDAGDLAAVHRAGRLRAGTRIILSTGHDMCLLDIITANGGAITEDGLIATQDDPQGKPFLWTLSAHLPHPEDYVLARSATNLPTIFSAGEWEDMAPRIPLRPLGEAGVSAAKTFPKSAPAIQRPQRH